MPEYYKSIQKISSVSIPASSRTWPAVSTGCGNGYSSYSARNVLIPSATTELYEPLIEFTSESSPCNGMTHSYPPYRATPYWICTTRKRNYLLRRRGGTNGYNCIQQYGEVRRVSNTCTMVPTGMIATGPKTAEWWEVTHKNIYDEFTVSFMDESSLPDTVERVKNDISLDALTCYDALTELAELKEVPALLRSTAKTLHSVLANMVKTHGVKTMKLAARMTPRKMLRSTSKALRRLGSEWMQYRYGIMPLVYSYRDLVKLSERGAVMTKRKSATLGPTNTGVLLPSSAANYRYKVVEGNIIVRGHVWQHFTSDGLAQASGVSVNPLVTAWELVPYSFVIDWALNVGDYITRKTTPLISNRIESCISLRRHLFEKTYVHFKNDSYTITYGNVLSSPWMGTQPPATPSKTIQRPEESQLWKETEIDEYQRFVVSVRDVQLRPSVSMNWKRGIDAAVMASNSLRDVIRRLK